MEAAVVSVATLRGLWQRSLIAWPDGLRDTTTSVYWLQGPSFYADLRQPAGRPDLSGIRCLDDLDREGLMWLAGQEGFAGELTFDGTCFEWARALDFQPKSPYSDCGFLHFEGDVLVERGRDVAYVEHWHRGPEATLPSCAVRLTEAGGRRAAFLVRAGDQFMFARDRATPLPEADSLADIVKAAPDMAHARDLLDCELSFGHVGDDGWLITRSSLPYREGMGLAPVTGHGGALLLTADVARDGTPISREWQIEALQGVLTDLVDFSALRPTALAR
ncbi:hypothetical protein DKG74_01460 [Zavarzinia aquatilis]|uniref:Uncharacterized protein n=1 Tax=Zavarzinia aquatilis TaxID=2211142 RepID=A0A317EF55_9PROT|nr:hypothetical protein DKG74_01460 [Zavarzinia aquatilis]